MVSNFGSLYREEVDFYKIPLVLCLPKLETQLLSRSEIFFTLYKKHGIVNKYIH